MKNPITTWKYGRLHQTVCSFTERALLFLLQISSGRWQCARYNKNGQVWHICVLQDGTFPSQMASHCFSTVGGNLSGKPSCYKGVLSAGRDEGMIAVCEAGGERVKRRLWIRRREEICRNETQKTHVFLARDHGRDPSRLMGSFALLAGLCSSLSGGGWCEGRYPSASKECN